MSTGRISTHDYQRPPDGHVDGPNACTECGYGPAAPCHPAVPAHVAAADAMAAEMRSQLRSLRGQGRAADRVAIAADVAIARIQAALRGGTATVQVAALVSAGEEGPCRA